MLIDNEEVYLPDLVKEIIVFHIREAFWKENDHEAMAQWASTIAENMGKNTKEIKFLSFMRNTRNLDHLAIVEITRKLASYI